MLIVALLVAQAAAPVSKIPDMKPVVGIPSLLESGMPEVPPQLRARIEQYQNSRSANALDVAADGSQLLIATRFASTNQLHVVEQPMGMRTPNDVTSYSLKDRKLTRWTRSEVGPVDAASFVEPELVKGGSYGG